MTGSNIVASRKPFNGVVRGPGSVTSYKVLPNQGVNETLRLKSPIRGWTDGMVFDYAAGQGEWSIVAGEIQFVAAAGADVSRDIPIIGFRYGEPANEIESSLHLTWANPEV